MKRKPSKESQKTGYYIRFTKRIIKLLIALFILYVVIIGIIWSVPKLWYWALG